MRVQRYPWSKTALINERGYVSFCECCCPGLPATMYFHVVPTYIPTGTGALNEDCAEQDEGTQDVVANGYGWQATGFIGYNCIGWVANPPTVGTTLNCEDPTGAPPEVWGVSAQLYCIVGSNFRSDMCINWGFVAEIDRPPDTGGCAELLTNMIPNVEYMCQAEEGERYVEFGPYVPGTESENNGCGCAYMFIWTDLPDLTAYKEFVYHYPGGGAAGMPGSLGGTVRYADYKVGIGTPPGDLDTIFN